MEEILASIRRIISDDDAPAAAAEPEAAPEPEPEPVDESAEMSQDDLDKLFDSDGGGFDVDEPEPAPEPEPEAEDEIDFDALGKEEDGDVLELTEDFATADEDDAPEMVEGLPEDTESGELAFVDDEKEADDAFEMADAEAEEEPEAAAPEPVAPEPPKHDYKPVRADAEPVEPEGPLMSGLTDSAVTSAFASLNNTVLSANARTLDDLVQEMLRPMIKAWLDDNLPTMVERLVRQEIERVTKGR